MPSGFFARRLFLFLDFLAAGVAGAEEAGMKGWRERAADVFADHGAIAAKRSSLRGLILRIFRTPIVVHWKTLPWHAIHAWTSRTRA